MIWIGRGYRYRCCLCNPVAWNRVVRVGKLDDAVVAVDEVVYEPADDMTSLFSSGEQMLVSVSLESIEEH